MMNKRKFNLLFLSTKTAGRSRMACAFAEKYASGQVSATCAGDKSVPIHPYALKVMEDIGLTIPRTVPNCYEDVVATPFDAVITLCENLSEECPNFPGSPAKIHWPFPDPAKFEGSDEELRESYRKLRDGIGERVRVLFEYGLLDSLLELHTTFSMLLNNMTDGVLTHDHNRRIYYFNQAAEEITGYSYSEIIGQDTREVFGGQFCPKDCKICEESEKSQPNIRFPLKFKRKGEQELDLEVSISALRSPVKAGTGAMIIFRDMTGFNRIRNTVKEEHSFQGIIGRDQSMHQVFEAIKNLADIEVPVLIQGESGAGKEMAAIALHKLSSRKNRPFVAVNCGALPEGTLESVLFGHVKGAFTSAIRDKKGRFELADRGTIFLDEIAGLSPAAQVKLLRVLQEKNFVPVGGEKTVSVDVRILCANNVNLKDLVIQGGFREDLYYRLAVAPVYLPPLRERGTDISLLADYFLDRYSLETARKVKSFSPEAISAMMSYDWPGNVRELANVIHFALIQCDGQIIEERHLPDEIRNFVKNVVHRKAGRPPKIEQERILEALKQADGNQSKAAEILGISRSTMYRMLKKP